MNYELGVSLEDNVRKNGAFYHEAGLLGGRAFWHDSSPEEGRSGWKKGKENNMYWTIYQMLGMALGASHILFQLILTTTAWDRNYFPIWRIIEAQGC